MSSIYKEGQFYGTEITVDNALNNLSENPVQNKVITNALSRKADLDESNKVPSSQLPSYVDDVIEGYYNTTDGKFYEDDQYTTEIEGEHGKIYVSLDTDKSYRWSTVFIEIVSGGSGTISRSITAAIDVGGVEAGDTFVQGTSYDDMWDALLNPTLYPTFTAPSVAMSYNADTYYVVKGTVPARTANLIYNAGAITLNGVKQDDRGGAATNYELATTGADTEYSDSSTSSGAFSVPALTRSTKGTIKLTATISYAAGPQPKDSKGNNYDSPLPAGSTTMERNINFIQAYFYGKSATSTISDFSGLTSDVKAKGNKTYKYTTNNEYMVMAYDSSYGSLTSILDGNGFETIGGWTKSSLTVDGFTYFVYVSDSPTTDTNAPFTFKY